MTTEEMIEVIENGTINQLTEEQKKEVFAFAFGNEFMESDNKGEKVKYKIR